MEIRSIKAFKILDSRQKETISIDVTLQDFTASASAPNGTSRGKKEAFDFSFNGIEYSIALIEKIGRDIINANLKLESFDDLARVEEIIAKYDHTQNYQVVGGNAVFALEAALLKAIARHRGIELWELLREGNRKFVKSRHIPMPLGNCIGGGKHATSRAPEFQEFLLAPKTNKFFEAYFINMQAYKKAKELMQRLNKLSGLTIENALCGDMENEEALDLLVEVRENIYEAFGIKLDIGIDIAASSFFKNNIYAYKLKSLNASRQLEYIERLVTKYGIFYVEDPFQEDDMASFARLNSVLKGKCLVVGDDLTCTNAKLIQNAITKNAISGVIIKPNQAGSLLKVRDAINVAKASGLKCIVSHRSGETTDDFIADLAFGWQADYLKAGIVGKEREAKLKRMIAIEKSLRGL
jgi:enolase